MSNIRDRDRPEKELLPPLCLGSQDTGRSGVGVVESGSRTLGGKPIPGLERWVVSGREREWPFPQSYWIGPEGLGPRELPGRNSGARRASSSRAGRGGAGRGGADGCCRVADWVPIGS